MPPKPNIKSVARAAAVSPSSVSNAYNKPDRLSAAVRARIFAVAQEQGYAGPDPAARSLRSRRAGAVGLLLTTQLSYAFSDPYCIELLNGVSEVAQQTRTSLLLIPLVPHTAAMDEEETRQSVEAVRHAVIDGVVADGIGDRHPALDIVRNRGLPLVRSVDDPDGSCVFVDDRAAGASVGAHLAELGHRDVAVVVVSTDEPGHAQTRIDAAALYPYSRLRLDGIRDGLGPEARITVISAGRNALESGRAAAELALDQLPRPSAIAGTTDALAFGALEVVRRRGLDVSVTGFDDVPAAEAAALTTVRQPIREKGRLMARMLLDLTFTPRRVVLDTELVARASTGPVQR